MNERLQAAITLYALLTNEETAKELQQHMQSDGLSEAEQLQQFISGIVDERYNP